MQVKIGTSVVCAALRMCSVDLPAHCLCANMKQFNGKHRWVYCENPAQENIPRVRDWLPGTELIRMHFSIVRNVREAVSSGEVVFCCVILLA